MSGPGLVLARVQGRGAPGRVWVKPSKTLIDTVSGGLGTKRMGDVRFLLARFAQVLTNRFR